MDRHRSQIRPEVSGAKAGAIVDALDRLRRLESERSAHRAFTEADDADADPGGAFPPVELERITDR